MSANSSIEWTDRTWNPTRGCSVVSPGCVNCYAMKQAHRFTHKRVNHDGGPTWEPGPYHGLTKQTKAGPQWTGKVVTVESALIEPLSWRKPQRVFVNSMSDLFHEDVPAAFIERVFSVMALAERHTFQVLTKRPERMLAWFRSRRFDVKGYAILQTEQAGECLYAHPWPLPNVWLGVSVENQHYADERIPLLLETPAAVRFISAEPLLGPVDLSRWLQAEHCNHPDEFCEDVGCRGETWLDWVIVGGESGPGARPFDLAWARSIVEQCKAAGVACFVKQLGADPFEPYSDGTRLADVPLRDRKGGDINEWPAELRVRQFPGDRHGSPSRTP